MDMCAGSVELVEETMEDGLAEVARAVGAVAV